MFLPKVGVAVEAVNSASWMAPAAVNGDPLPSRSRHARVSVVPTVISGLLLSVMLPAARPTPFMYRAQLALRAVRPSPNRSYAMPTRGLISFQLATRPVHPAFRLFLPSEHSL